MHAGRALTEPGIRRRPQPFTVSDPKDRNHHGEPEEGRPPAASDRDGRCRRARAGGSSGSRRSRERRHHGRQCAGRPLQPDHHEAGEPVHGRHGYQRHAAGRQRADPDRRSAVQHRARQRHRPVDPRRVDDGSDVVGEQLRSGRGLVQQRVHDRYGDCAAGDQRQWRDDLQHLYRGRVRGHRDRRARRDRDRAAVPGDAAAAAEQQLAHERLRLPEEHGAGRAGEGCR
ncbi:hypothetical protein MICRO8M_100019 [Microbacterium sp. 8M]|nr:hypothetical protein MICRO8M_100019 [Microbacterium sp. 8M]